MPDLYPEFLFANGELIPERTGVPQDVDAKMYAWSDSIKSVLLDQVHEGVHFRLTEGPFPEFLVGVGTVKAVGPYLSSARENAKP